jgi:hypothetical protein
MTVGNKNKNTDKTGDRDELMNVETDNLKGKDGRTRETHCKVGFGC